MKRVSYYSKEPTLSIIKNIADNLREKLDLSIKVEIGYWSHSSSLNKYYSHGISLVGTKATNYSFKTWSELLLAYRKLMEGETP